MQASNHETSKQHQHLQEQSRVISNLRQELIRSDNQLETVKRQVKQQKQETSGTANTTIAPTRSSSAASRYQVSRIEQSSTIANTRRVGATASASVSVRDNVYRPPPTPPARLRYSREREHGLNESLDGVDHSQLPTSTPPRASSTSRLNRSRANNTQSQGPPAPSSAVATPERDTRRNRPAVTSPAVTSPSIPPAVVRVRTSRSQPVATSSTPPPSRRRPSLESIGSNSGEKKPAAPAVYTSTRNNSSNVRR